MNIAAYRVRSASLTTQGTALPFEETFFFFCFVFQKRINYFKIEFLERWIIDLILVAFRVK